LTKITVDEDQDKQDLPVDFRLDELRALAGDTCRAYVSKHADGAWVLMGKKTEIPDLDDVGREFGPGKFQIKVSYKKENSDSKNPWTWNTVTFSLGSPYLALHKAYLKEQREAFGEDEAPKSSRSDSMRELVDMMLLMKGLFPQPGPSGNNDNLRDITPILTAALGRPQAEDQTSKILLPLLLESMKTKDQAPGMESMLSILKTGLEIGSNNSGKEEGGGITGILEALAPALMGVLGPKLAPSKAVEVPGEVVDVSNPKVRAVLDGLRKDPQKARKMYEQVKAVKGKEFADNLARQNGIEIPKPAPQKLKQLEINLGDVVEL